MGVKDWGQGKDDVERCGCGCGCGNWMERGGRGCFVEAVIGGQ